MIERRLATTHISIQPAHKPTPKILRTVESYLGLALRRVMHDDHGEEQRIAERDKIHQKITQ